MKVGDWIRLYDVVECYCEARAVNREYKRQRDLADYNQKEKQSSHARQKLPRHPHRHVCCHSLKINLIPIKVNTSKYLE